LPMEDSTNPLKYHDDYQKDMAQKFAMDLVPPEMKPRSVDDKELKYPNLPKYSKTSDLQACFDQTENKNCNEVDYNTRTPERFELKPQHGTVRDHYNNINNYNMTPLRDVLLLSFSQPLTTIGTQS